MVVNWIDYMSRIWWCFGWAGREACNDNEKGAMRLYKKKHTDASHLSTQSSIVSDNEKDRCGREHSMATTGCIST